jgi:hypothetical protein
MLQINQSRQHDGYTFSLSPISKEELRRLRPGVHPLPRLFIAFENAGEFQHQRGDLYDHVAQLLTRLTQQELEAIGGFKIVDPLTNERVDA